MGEVLPVQEGRPLGRASLLSAVWAPFVAFDATGLTAGPSSSLVVAGDQESVG
jgi:hypothetical protein